jgi:hypothetical protein
MCALTHACCVSAAVVCFAASPPLPQSLLVSETERAALLVKLSDVQVSPGPAA